MAVAAQTVAGAVVGPAEVVDRRAFAVGQGQ